MPAAGPHVLKKRKQMEEKIALLRSLVQEAASGANGDGTERCPWCYSYKHGEWDHKQHERGCKAIKALKDTR